MAAESDAKPPFTIKNDPRVNDIARGVLLLQCYLGLRIVRCSLTPCPFRPWHVYPSSLCFGSTGSPEAVWGMVLVANWPPADVLKGPHTAAVSEIRNSVR